MLLESRLQDARGEKKASNVESKIMVETYAKELETVKEKYMYVDKNSKYSAKMIYFNMI